MTNILVFLILCLFACNAFAQSADWQKTWDETLAAAKKEGKIVVVGSPDPVMRKEIIPKFTERFGITVEFIAGQSGQIAARVRTERLSASIRSMFSCPAPAPPSTCCTPKK